MRRRLIPRSLQGSLLLTFLALNILSVGAFIAWSAQRVETDTVEQAEHDLEIQSHIISDALREAYDLQQQGLTDPAGSLESQVAAYAKKNGVHVTVIDANLHEVVNSSPNGSTGHLEDHPEIIAARGGTEQHDIRLTENHTELRLYVATALKGGQNVPEGYVQLSVPMAPIYADVEQAKLTLLGAGAVVVLITALASLLLARQIASPVRKLTATSEAIAHGHLEGRVTPAGPDEIQRLGRAFNLMAAQVSDMLTREQEFVANAAHELRSPLTSIRLRLEMLQVPGRADAEITKHYLSQMDRELARLQRLVEHLLTLSVLDQNQRAPTTMVDLSPLLYELVDEMSPLVREAGVELRIDVPDHLPKLNANADQMRIAVRNLLDNAIKFTPASGRVSLAAVGENGTVKIQVTDTGVGITPEALPHIFDRFFRADRSRSGRRGSGLGLALVRSIAEANGGEIKVASVIGGGSTFTLEFPVSTS
jgi:signal transduction histidine kinase